jgi:hypothetical protein
MGFHATLENQRTKKECNQTYQVEASGNELEELLGRNESVHSSYIFINMVSGDWARLRQYEGR